MRWAQLRSRRNLPRPSRLCLEQSQQKIFNDFGAHRARNTALYQHPHTETTWLRQVACASTPRAPPTRSIDQYASSCVAFAFLLSASPHPSIWVSGNCYLLVLCCGVQTDPNCDGGVTEYNFHLVSARLLNHHP